MAEAAAPGTPRRLARTPSSLGVWWKLGDAAAAVDSSPDVERRLRGIAEEEAAVRVRMERRHAGAPAVRRRVALTSISLEAVALMYGLWAARRREETGGWRSRRALKLLLLPALAIPALASIVLAAFARFRRICNLQPASASIHSCIPILIELTSASIHHLHAVDRRDHQKLERLRAQRNASIGTFRGSHHNLQKLIEKYDPDAAADSKDFAAPKKLKRTHSRLSFHVGDE